MKSLIINIICISLVGCGYTISALRGGNIQNIHIDTFLNKTYEQGLDRLITDAVIDEFIFKGGIKVVEEDRADARLKGTIKKYVLKPISYDRENQAEEYRLRIIVDVSLEDVATKKTIWHSRDISGEWTFLFTGPLSIPEEEARDKAIEYLAREIVQQTLEMW